MNSKRETPRSRAARESSLSSSGSSAMVVASVKGNRDSATDDRTGRRAAALVTLSNGTPEGCLSERASGIRHRTGRMGPGGNRFEVPGANRQVQLAHWLRTSFTPDGTRFGPGHVETLAWAPCLCAARRPARIPTHALAVDLAHHPRVTNQC